MSRKTWKRKMMWIPFNLKQRVYALRFGLLTVRSKCPVCKGTRAISKGGHMMDCPTCNMTGFATSVSLRRWSVPVYKWPIARIEINSEGISLLLGESPEYMSARGMDTFTNRRAAELEVKKRNKEVVIQEERERDPEYTMKKVLGLAEEEGDTDVVL